MVPFRVYGALEGEWCPLGCMVPFRVCGTLEGEWCPLGCMVPFRVMRPFRMYGAL